MRYEMNEKRSTLAIFQYLDDITYLLNLRAMGVIETCPVGIGYTTVSDDGDAFLYCDAVKVSDGESGVSDHPEEGGFRVIPCKEIALDVEDHV